MIPKYTTLQSTHPGCGTDYQWFSTEGEVSVFEQLHSRAPSSHTKKEIVLQATGAGSQPSSHLQSKRTPTQSALPPPYLEREQPAEHILGGKKGGTMGHVLLLVLPCFIGLLGLCNIWLFTRMIKG